MLTIDCTDIPPFVSHLIKHPDPYRPFLPFLDHSSNPEDPIPLLASSVLSAILSNALGASTKPPPHVEEALPKLNKYLATLSANNDSGLQDIAVQQYASVLRTKKSRELFWKQRKQTVDPLVDILRAAAGSSKDNDSALFSGGASIRGSPSDGLSGGVGIQLLYHVLLVFWQLSFEGELVGAGLDE